MSCAAAASLLALHLVGQDDPAGVSGGIQHFGFKLNTRDHDQVIAQVERAGGALVSRGKHDGKYPYAYVSGSRRVRHRAVGPQLSTRRSSTCSIRDSIQIRARSVSVSGQTQGARGGLEVTQ